MLRQIKKILREFLNIGDKVIIIRGGMLAGFIIVILYIFNFTYRMVTRSSFYWIEELGGVLLIWMTGFGAASMYINNKEAEIRTIVEMISPRISFFVERIIIALCFMFGLALLYSCIVFLPYVAKWEFYTLPFSATVTVFPIIMLAVIIIIYYFTRGSN